MLCISEKNICLSFFPHPIIHPVMKSGVLMMLTHAQLSLGYVLFLIIWLFMLWLYSGLCMWYALSLYYLIWLYPSFFIWWIGSFTCETQMPEYEDMTSLSSMVVTDLLWLYLDPNRKCVYLYFMTCGSSPYHCLNRYNLIQARLSHCIRGKPEGIQKSDLLCLCKFILVSLSI